MIARNVNNSHIPTAFWRCQAPFLPSETAPKCWGVDGVAAVGAGTLCSAGGSFMSSGVAPGDPVYLLSGTPGISFATSVYEVMNDTTLLINGVVPVSNTDIVYKVGVGAMHTLSSLAHLVSRRGILHYCLWNKTLFTSGNVDTFSGGLDGDIYISEVF